MVNWAFQSPRQIARMCNLRLNNGEPQRAIFRALIEAAGGGELRVRLSGPNDGMRIICMYDQEQDEVVLRLGDLRDLHEATGWGRTCCPDRCNQPQGGRM